MYARSGGLHTRQQPRLICQAGFLRVPSHRLLRLGSLDGCLNQTPTLHRIKVPVSLGLF
jgi:hypothetical protein